MFYLLDGDSNASSWHRALQYFPLLRAYGLRPLASRPVPAAVYQRLVETGPHNYRQKLAFYGLFAASRLLDVARAGRFDVVVIQRDLFPFGPPVLERLLRRLNSRLVYDTDDATYLRPSFTPRTPLQRLRRFDKVVEVVRGAAWVSVATEALADWVRPLNPRVEVLPMAVDPRPYEIARRQPSERASDAPLVIGWAGTGGGLRYLEPLGPVLRQLAQRTAVEVRVVSGAGSRLRLPGVPLRVTPWRPETVLSEMAEFDVGLVPLDDAPFERAKFPFKLLQYLALGIPAVCARVGTAATLLTEGETGLLASTPEEWLAALERLARDRPLRQRLGGAGARLVADRFTIERVGPRLAAGLSRVASSAYP